MYTTTVNRDTVLFTGYHKCKAEERVYCITDKREVSRGSKKRVVGKSYRPASFDPTVLTLSIKIRETDLDLTNFALGDDGDDCCSCCCFFFGQRLKGLRARVLWHGNFKLASARRNTPEVGIEIKVFATRGV